MDKQWFECRISYDQTMDNGIQRRVIENYLVQAINFTEAEANITKEMQPFISGDFTVSAVRRRNYEAVLVGNEKYYRAKLIVTTIDEKTAAEKHTSFFMLANAISMQQAIADIDGFMRGTMLEYEFHTVTETTILDVFRSDE